MKRGVVVGKESTRAGASSFVRDSICGGASLVFLPAAHPWLALGGIALRSLLLLTAHLGLPADSGIKPSSRLQLA
ncbi:hypothetical protein K2X30_11445 [bacterium]|nr:hypothetical protein [bacterium]